MATKPKNVDVPIPARYSDAYTADDQAKVVQIIHWLNGAHDRAPGYGEQRTRAKLGRAAGINPTTMHRIIQGDYPSSPTKYLDLALTAIANDGERKQLNAYNRLTFAETSVTRTVFSVCHRVNLYKDIGVIAGRPGTGKSEGLARYCASNPSAILIDATWNMSQGILLDKLVSITDAEVKTAQKWSNGTQAQRLDAVINKLNGQDRIIIIDEADLMAPATLETLRRINDLAKVGIVLAGEPKLHAMISNADGRFGRIFSRVGFWVPVIKSITADDCRALIDASLPEHKIDDALHDAFWQVCEGSVRTLSKLLPNVRDFGIAQGHELTPELVFKVAQKTLRMDGRKSA